MRNIERILAAILVFIFSLHLLSVLGFYFDTLFEKMIFIVLEIIVLSLLGFVYSYNKEHHMKKRSVITIHKIIFMIYLISLTDVLFLSSDLHRDATLLAEYSHMNTIPFHTINLYITGYQNGTVTLNTLLLNVLGNFVLFMPLAYFVPFFFKNMRKWYIFLMMMISLTLVIEIIQINLGIGSADIDDIILNVAGAMSFFIISQFTFSKPIYRILGRE